jgi:hypothetical protein
MLNFISDCERYRASPNEKSRYGCVVIGAGVRLPPSRLVLFEALVDVIHRAAPSAAIAFNTRPEDTGAAAARWI